MVEPLIHAKTEGGSTEFLAELGGEKSLVNLTRSQVLPERKALFPSILIRI